MLSGHVRQGIPAAQQHGSGRDRGVSGVGDREPVNDVALKTVDVKPGLLVVERQIWLSRVPRIFDGVGEGAGEAVLEHPGASPADALKPKVLASRIVKRVHGYHAFLINRNKSGSMVLSGESLFVLEMEPAAYAIIAANEAESRPT